MGWGCRPGPTGHNPFSKYAPSRTPSPLGCNDAADPGFLTLRGNTPGSVGVNDDAGFDIQRMVDPLDYDYLLRHHESKSHLVEAVKLSDLRLSFKDPQTHKNVWANASVWKVAGAIVFRVSELSEDVDGYKRAYHPATDSAWDGYDNGVRLGRDSLANAIKIPGVTAYAHSGPKNGQPHDEQLWALTAGCQLFRDLDEARGLEPKAAPPSPPPGQPAAGQPPATPPSQAALDARAKLDKIYKTYSVTKLSELETQSKSAVCVLYVPGRPKKDSQNDWKHVVSWAGVQSDGRNGSGNPKLFTQGPNTGFCIPAITPSWVEPFTHPWVVLNWPENEFGVRHTNKAVVIKNGESPKIAYGLVADSGPKGHLGEVSNKMMTDLGVSRSNTGGDFIMVLFPEEVSAADMEKEKEIATIRSDAQAAFEAWTWEGRSGIDLIKELFPTSDQYHQVLKDFANSKQYLNAYIDQMMLKQMKLDVK